MSIPKEIRDDIASDPFMMRCVYKNVDAPNHNCSGRIEWEHAFIYKKQIQEKWAIIPCCTSHNRGNGIVKEYNWYWALKRANDLGVFGDIKKRMPKHNWDQQWKYLNKKYGKGYTKINT